MTERKTIDMTALGFRPTFTSAIYFAIVKFNDKMKTYPDGDQLSYLNTKPTWVGYFPEEVGYKYQDLCQYQRHHGCQSGMKIDVDGTVTLYTSEQLDNDYDRDSDNSTMSETNDYHWQNEDRDIERAREAGRISE